MFAQEESKHVELLKVHQHVVLVFQHRCTPAHLPKHFTLSNRWISKEVLDSVSRVLYIIKFHVLRSSTKS